MWPWTIHFTSLNRLSHEMKILICLIRLFRLCTRASCSHLWTVKQQLHYYVYMLFHTFSLYTSASWPWSIWGWHQALPPELVVIQLIDSTCIMPRKLRYSLMVLGVPSQVALMVKKSVCNAGDARDTGLIPGSGKAPGEGNGNPFQYSCLENSMDRGAWQARVHGVAKSSTWLRD